MNNINKTLYIPLYGKAYLSRRELLLQDRKAEEIWDKEGFALKGKAKSRWLAYYMGMRSILFDRWTQEQLQECPRTVILHLGCGMDSRCIRVDAGENLWYDVDFPEVMEARKRYFAQSETYRMIFCDIREDGWWKEIPSGAAAVIVMEGISMYLQPSELKMLLKGLKDHFGDIRILMDCYTPFGARASKYKNPINEVGVTRVFGLEDPRELEADTGIVFLREHAMTPDWLIDRLPKKDRRIFRKLFAGRLAKKIYRLYEFY